LIITDIYRETHREKLPMISLTIKEIRTPGVKFKEFLALNQEDEVQLFQFEDEIFSGRVFDKIYSEFSEIISKKKII
jgi:hypothetical protein